MPEPQNRNGKGIGKRKKKISHTKKQGKEIKKDIAV